MVFDSDSLQRRAVSLGGLAVVVYTISTSDPRPSLSGTGLGVLLLTVVAGVTWAAFVAVGSRHARVSVGALLMCGMSGAALMSVSTRSGAALFPFITVFAAARALDLKPATVVAGATLVCLAGTAVPAGRSLTTMLGIGAGLVAAHLGGRTIREYIVSREAAELLLAETQRAREEQARSAALAERARIAREIHDVLAHSLSALAVQLEGARMLLANGDAATAAVQVEQARRLARQGLDETRQAIGALRGDLVPTVALLEGLVHDARDGGEAALTLEGAPWALAPEVGLAVYRVAQEATTNARRHAPGSAIDMRLVYGDATVALTVTNQLSDGSHQATGVSTRGGGYGLTGMRERAELLGGTLVAGPAGSSWRVELVVPA
ncbi:MAG: sensor histidine kinase [Candidatus Dormibacteria bacterium]